MTVFDLIRFPFRDWEQAQIDFMLLPESIVTEYHYWVDEEADDIEKEARLAKLRQLVSDYEERI